jgi:hypothetical protein
MQDIISSGDKHHLSRKGPTVFLIRINEIRENAEDHEASDIGH